MQMPDVIVDYDMSRRTFSIVHQEDVLGVSAATGSSSQTFDREVDELPEASEDKEKDIQNCEVCPWKDFSDAYLCETKEVLSHDGVVVPLTILYSKKSHLKDQSPGILLGYGAYGETLDKSWCSDRLSLLDRGWVVAFADVRSVISRMLLLFHFAFLATTKTETESKIGWGFKSGIKFIALLGDVRNSEIPSILLGHQSLLSANERNSEEKTSSLFARYDLNAGRNPGECRIVVIDRQCITFLLDLKGTFRTGRRPETMGYCLGNENPTANSCEDFREFCHS